MKAIILCGMPAVGKTTVARIIAAKLRLQVVGGGDILKEIAVEDGYDAGGDDWWDTAEGMKFMDEREGSSEFDKEVDRRLLARAKKGDVVMTSYTLPWISKDGIKIWLSGTKESRAQRMAVRDSTTAEEVAKVIDARDSENYMLYKKLYGIEFGKDLSPFNIIVGTDGIPAGEVAKRTLAQLPVEKPAPKKRASKKPASSKKKKSGRKPSR